MKLFKSNNLISDSLLSRFYYKITIYILCACGLMVLAKQFFGNPIDCVILDLHQRDLVPRDMMESYCMTSSYIIRHPPGQGATENRITRGSAPEIKTYQLGYACIWIVLLIQAFLFYIPKFMWKRAEGGLVKKLVQGLNNPLMEENQKSQKFELLKEYFLKTLHQHNIYGFLFFFCQFLALLNIVTQFLLISAFPENDMVFSQIGKCTYNIYGESGNNINVDAQCNLHLNIIYKAIYEFLRLWLIILTIVSGINFLRNLAFTFSSKMRLCQLRALSPLSYPDRLLRLDMISTKFRNGDWVLFLQVVKNMDRYILQEFLQTFEVVEFGK